MRSDAFAVNQYLAVVPRRYGKNNDMLRNMSASSSLMMITSCRHSDTTKRKSIILQRGLASTSSISTSDEEPPSIIHERNTNILSTMYGVTGILSALAWIATSYVALSFHPDPKFADCTLRHNLLTMSQAFALPSSHHVGNVSGITTEYKTRYNILE